MLATDPVFLLTHTFDWGPVALQILLTTAGLYALSRFGSRNRSLTWLVAGFFYFGLALWNKALFSWILVGLAVGSVVFAREIWKALSVRNVLAAAAAFALGAGPLIDYNLRHDFVTLRENAQLEPEKLGKKWIQVPAALLGRSLLGYVVQEEEAPQPKPAYAASEWLRQRLGQRRESVFLYVIGALLLAVPLWWRSRTAWFAILAFFAGWLPMGLTAGAGDSAHHVILLWPLPLLFAAIALGGLPKWLSAPIAIAVLAANLVVLHQYHYQFQRFGAGDSFTDALFPLSDDLAARPGKTIYITDWGMFDSLVLMQEGRLSLRIVSGQLSTEAPSEPERADIARMLADPQAVLVTHVREREVFPNVGAHLETAAAASGQRLRLERTIRDSNGRPVFETWTLAATQR